MRSSYFDRLMVIAWCFQSFVGNLTANGLRLFILFCLEGVINISISEEFLVHLWFEFASFSEISEVWGGLRRIILIVPLYIFCQEFIYQINVNRMVSIFIKSCAPKQVFKK